MLDLDHGNKGFDFGSIFIGKTPAGQPDWDQIQVRLFCPFGSQKGVWLQVEPTEVARAEIKEFVSHAELELDEARMKLEELIQGMTKKLQGSAQLPAMTSPIELRVNQQDDVVRIGVALKNLPAVKEPGELPGYLVVKLVTAGTSELPKFRLEVERLELMVGGARLNVPGLFVGVEPQCLLTYSLKDFSWELKNQAIGSRRVATVYAFHQNEASPHGGLEFAVEKLSLPSDGGVDFEARISPKSLQVAGLEDVLLRDGRISCQGTRWALEASADFKLDYFVGAEGTLRIHGSGGGGAPSVLGGSVLLNTDISWTDPSGLLCFDQVGASLKLSVKDGGGLEAQGAFSGCLVFNPVPLVGWGKDWLKGIFSGLTMQFEELNLKSLRDANFELQPSSAIRVSAWDIFDLSIPKIRMSKEGVTLLDGDLGFDLGDIQFGGSLPSLKIALSDGKAEIASAEGKGEGFRFSGSLTAPGGVRARVEVRSEKTALEENFIGLAEMSTPMLPGVSALAIIGRFRPTKGAAWVPRFTLYGEAETSIVVMPGLVLRRLGVGLGINSRLSGLDSLSVQEAHRLLKEGLPDPSRADGWESSAETQICLAARAFAASRPGSNDMVDFYAADLGLMLTEDFQLAALGKLWLQTSIKDARTQPFQQKPAVRAIVLVDGQEPSLRVAAQTVAKPLSTQGDRGGLTARLFGTPSLPPTKLSMEASPSSFALAIGPTQFKERMGPMALQGESFAAVRASGAGVFVLGELKAAGKAGASAHARLGPASFRISFSTGVALELTMLGAYAEDALLVYGRTRVSAHASLSVHVQIGFRKRIKVGWVNITISWHVDWDFSLHVHADIDLEVGVSTSRGVGFQGTAHIRFRVLGYSPSLGVRMSHNTHFLEAARGQAKQAKQLAQFN